MPHFVPLPQVIGSHGWLTPVTSIFHCNLDLSVVELHV